jgi:hypothetical protein
MDFRQSTRVAKWPGDPKDRSTFELRRLPTPLTAIVNQSRPRLKAM